MRLFYQMIHDDRSPVVRRSYAEMLPVTPFCCRDLKLAFQFKEVFFNGMMGPGVRLKGDDKPPGYVNTSAKTLRESEEFDHVHSYRHSLKFCPFCGARIQLVRYGTDMRRQQRLTTVTREEIVAFDTPMTPEPAKKNAVKSRRLP